MRAILKSKGPGRGWWGPPRGTHTAREGQTVKQIVQRDLNTAVNGSRQEVNEILGKLGYSQERISSLDDRQARLVASKRTPAPVSEWLSTQGETVTVYHGTSTQLIDKIKQEGFRAQESAFHDIGQSAGVFLVNGQNQRWAEYWANRSVERNGGEPLVVGVRIPKSTIQIDPANARSFMLSPTDIPFSSVLSMTQLGKSPSGSKGFSFYETVDDPRGGTNQVQVNDLFANEMRTT